MEPVARTVIRVDVSDVAPPGCGELALEAVHPATAPKAVLFCFPGGGMSRRYFDLAAPGYSFAEYASRRGFLVAGLDHPGTGDSDAPDDGWTLTPEVVASIEATAVDRARALLGAGAIPAIGVGHSAGAHLLLHQYGRSQGDNSKINGIPAHNESARSRTAQPVSGTRFVGLALLGWAGHGLPRYLDDADLRIGELAATDPEAFARELVASARRKFGHPFPVLEGRGTSGLLISRPPPDHVRRALADAGAPLLAVVGHASMIPGTASPAAAAVDVPVFLGVGEHDIASPQGLPGEFPASSDVTLYVLPGAGHNHNVEPGREQLWERLTRWADELTGSRRTWASSRA